MENESYRSITNCFQPRDVDLSERIQMLMNLERYSLEVELAALKRESKTESDYAEINQYQKVLDAMDYFNSNGGIIKAKEKQEKEVQQGLIQLSESKQYQRQLQNQLCYSLENVRQEQEEAKKLRKSLTLQLKADQKEYSQRKQQYDQELQFYYEEEAKINLIRQQEAYLQNQIADKQQQLVSIQVLKKEDEQEREQQVESIKSYSTAQIDKSLEETEKRLNLHFNKILAQKQNDWEQQKRAIEDQIISLNQQYCDLEEQRRKVKEILKPAELNKAKTEEDFKHQLENLNPQHEVSQSEVEFVKQFQAVQEEIPTVEQVKVIETKHQQVKQVLIKQLKENQEKSQSLVSQEEQDKIEGYRGVLLMHAMLAEQGITSYITDKPISQIEQCSKGVYQQKIIQCGIQDSSSYFTANYASPAYMEKQILEAKSLKNYIQNFKINMVKKLGEKDVTPLNIQVFAVTTSPACVNFQINSIDAKQIEIKSKDFSSLGINNVETQNLLDKAELSIDMFDPDYNMSWDDMTSATAKRGALLFYNKADYVPQVYKFPFGYYGLGLRVLDRYGNDQRWIRADTQPGTWIVLFHGTGHKNLKGIIDPNKINPGYNNNCGGQKCRITGKFIKTGHYANTYLADDVQLAQHYSLRLNLADNVYYSLVFQCRVDPTKIKSPEANPGFYAVENPLDEIRPYRLLIREIRN